MNATLIDLRTDERGRLVGRLDPVGLRLHVRHRGEVCVFDLPSLARSSGVELVRVRSGGQQLIVDGEL